MVTTLYLIRHGEAEGGEIRRYKGTIDVPLSEKGVRQMAKISAFIIEKLKNLSNSSQNVIARSSDKIGTTKQSHNSEIASPAAHNDKNVKLQAVYCSDLSRAIKSAAIIAEPQSLKPIVVPSLRERNFGLWEGMSFDEIKEKYPEEFDAWAGNPLKYSPMGGESTLEVRDRVIAALDRILDENYIGRIQGFKDSSEKVNKSLESPNPRTLESICIVIVAHGGVNRIVLCHLLGMPLENIFRIEQNYGAVNIIEFWDKYPLVKLINGIINV